RIRLHPWRRSTSSTGVVAVTCPIGLPSREAESGLPSRTARVLSRAGGGFCVAAAAGGGGGGGGGGVTVGAVSVAAAEAAIHPVRRTSTQPLRVSIRSKRAPATAVARTGASAAGRVRSDVPAASATATSKPS